MENRQNALLEIHKNNGVIDVAKLTPGTRITLETPVEFCELEVATPSLKVVLLASNCRFKFRDKGVVMGSLDPRSGIFLPDIIGQGLTLRVRMQDAQIAKIGPVKSAVIRGHDDEYAYSLWGDE